MRIKVEGRGRNGQRRLPGKAACGGEVAECQRSHEPDIESISFMFNTHMDEKSNWRCGVSLGVSLSIGVCMGKPPRVCMFTVRLCACVSKQIYEFICALLCCITFYLHILSICCPCKLNFSSPPYDRDVFLGMRQKKRSTRLPFPAESFSFLQHGLVYFAAPLVGKQWLLQGVGRHSLNKWA